MISKNKIKVMGLIGITALGIGYKSMNEYFDHNIDSIIKQKGHISEWVNLLPGKSDKILDVYLDEMKSYYENGHLQLYRFEIERVWNFAEEHNPKRLEDVCTRLVDFLLEKGEVGDAMDYAEFFTYQFKSIFKDDRLVKKTAQYRYDPKGENDRLIERVKQYNSRHNK